MLFFFFFEAPAEDEIDTTPTCCCIWKDVFVIWITTINFLSIVSLPIIIYYSDCKSLEPKVWIILALILIAVTYLSWLLTFGDRVVVKLKDYNIFAFCFTVLNLYLGIFLLSEKLPWNPLPIVILIVISVSFLYVVLPAYVWYDLGHDRHMRMHRDVNLSKDLVRQWSSSIGMGATHASACRLDQQIHEATKEHQRRSESFDGPSKGDLAPYIIEVPGRQYYYICCCNAIKVCLACFVWIISLLSNIVILPGISIYFSTSTMLAWKILRCDSSALGALLFWRWWKAEATHEREACYVFGLAFTFTLLDIVSNYLFLLYWIDYIE